jgi:hypothetical protein
MFLPMAVLLYNSLSYVGSAYLLWVNEAAEEDEYLSRFGKARHVPDVHLRARAHTLAHSCSSVCLSVRMGRIVSLRYWVLSHIFTIPKNDDEKEHIFSQVLPQCCASVLCHHAPPYTYAVHLAAAFVDAHVLVDPVLE